MDLDAQNSSSAVPSLEQNLILTSELVQQIQDYLIQARLAALPAMVYRNVSMIQDSVEQVIQQVAGLERECQDLQALASLGQYINSTLELDSVLQIVMDTVVRLTKAERGFLMLKNESGQLVMRTGRDWEQESIDSSELAISRTVIYRVVGDGQAVLTTNAQEDPRFHGQASIAALNLLSILCVPLKVKGVVTGVIYMDNRIKSGLFTLKDLELLSAFADQAAVAIENARLFQSVSNTLSEVTELKKLMDNVFSSIASGVLITDSERQVLMCNRAAEQILGQDANHLVGKGLSKTISPFVPVLDDTIHQVLNSDQPVLGVETRSRLPGRGEVNLRLNISPLKDGVDVTHGVAVVLEDLTEKKQLEASRRLFERMVSPAVIEQLDPYQLHLGGKRQEITVLFADIHGFTGLGEEIPPEVLVTVVNRYLALAAEAILEEAGTIDKFLGDAVMAWFNAPIEQPHHILKAVRAAVAIRDRLEPLHASLPQSFRLSFSIGLHTGEAVLGLVGSEERTDYTAIGDGVNTAKRIQEHASPGQILISEQAYRRVADSVEARRVKPIQAKGKKEPLVVYEVVRVNDLPAASGA
ncbi:MAG: adenylate/guanylate cyclase domain-containing protein [Anaerolineaceae bacterium]|nr:adenylate/guanylate cyclase domain-containing protein [Anaerolineaceae bacterium]